MKFCPSCGLEKAAAEFYPNDQTKDGLTVKCRMCAPSYMRRNWSGVPADEKTAAQWAIFKRTKSRAKSAGTIFNIEFEDLVWPDVCPVLGLPLDYRALADKRGPASSRRERVPSIDRIDSSRGYEKENVVVVSWRANRLKNNAAIEELRQLSDFYSNLEKERGRSHNDG